MIGVDLAAWIQRRRLSPAPDRQAIFEPARGGWSCSPDRLKRAAAYLAGLPRAISGQRGHNQTFRAACVLIKGFDLAIDEARPLLQGCNQGCDPPWSERELEHKLRDADAREDGQPRGYLLRTNRQRPDAGAARVQAGGDDRGEPWGQAGLHQVSPRLLEGQEANPHRLARLFGTERFAFSGVIGLRYWREEFHAWDGSAY
jgi:hypothetical protein